MANSLRNKIKHFCYKGYLSESERDRLLNVLDDADRINSELKQQPCMDCISRAEVLNSLKGFEILHNHDELRSNLIYGIMNLPSVTPKQRVGRWILEEVKDEDGRPYDIKYFCSECQAERPPIWDDYCGSCGAKMEVNADEDNN